LLFIVNGLDHGPGPAVADRPIASELKEIREWKSKRSKGRSSENVGEVEESLFAEEAHLPGAFTYIVFQSSWAVLVLVLGPLGWLVLQFICM
jgi:hypothetical protein